MAISRDANEDDDDEEVWERSSDRSSSTLPAEESADDRLQTTADEEDDDCVPPTQVIEDDFDTMPQCQTDDDDDDGNGLVLRDGSNSDPPTRHYGQLVRLKSTLTRHEIPFKELYVDREIGKGFFGKVYKATWRGKAVALKKITITKFRDRSETDIFDKEAAIISKLCHPMCVMFIGQCSEPDNRFIVMEYMAGGSLRRLLDERPTLATPPRQLQIARNIAEGMHYLHTNFDEPIIHRDLTSSNVLLDGDYSVAKINDFGLSKEMKAGINEMTAAMGSLAWMAPECFRGEKYTEKVDIYSFAIILWELMTQRDPYCGIEPLKMAFLAAMEDYRPPISQVPAQWQPLIAKCWHAKPDQRPSFAQIIQDIGEIEESSTFAGYLKKYTQGNSRSSSTLQSPSSFLQQSNSPPSSQTSSTSSQPMRAGYYATSGSGGSTTMECEPVNSPPLSPTTAFKVRPFGQGVRLPGSISCLEVMGPMAMVGCTGDSGIRMYDITTETQVKTLMSDHPVRVIQSNLVNNKSFVASCGGGTMSLWDITASNNQQLPLKTLRCGETVSDMAWNLQNIVTISNDTKVQLWDVEKGVVLTSMDSPIPQLCVAALPYNPLIASGGADGKVRLWDTRTGHNFRSFQGNSGQIHAIKFRSPLRDPIIMTGTGSGQFSIWNIVEQEDLKMVNHYNINNSSPITSAQIIAPTKIIFSQGTTSSDLLQVLTMSTS
eukprot:gene6185-7163_t